jgi:hypothetical protein
MTIQEHIAYHEDKINRLYAEHDRVQEQIHKATSENSHIKADELMMYAKSLYNIELDLRASIDIRVTFLAVKSLNDLKN